jgi:hypothetical protein
LHTRDDDGFPVWPSRTDGWSIPQTLDSVGSSSTLLYVDRKNQFGGTGSVPELRIELS